MSYPFTIKDKEVSDEVEYVEWQKVIKGKLRKGHFWREKYGKPPTGMRFVKANGCWFTEATVRARYKGTRSHKNRAIEVRINVWSLRKLSDEKLIEIALTQIEESPNFDWFDFYNQTVLVGDNEQFRTDPEGISALKELTESDEDLELESSKCIDIKGWGYYE